MIAFLRNPEFVVRSVDIRGPYLFKGYSFVLYGLSSELEKLIVTAINVALKKSSVQTIK